jgi:hypothetical protein
MERRVGRVQCRELRTAIYVPGCGSRPLRNTPLVLANAVVSGAGSNPSNVDPAQPDKTASHFSRIGVLSLNEEAVL